MRFKFSKVYIQNFKAVREKQVLDLTSRPAGLHYVKGVNEIEPQLGSNGAGKSTIWDAVCWCLYGKTPEGLRNPDVKPWSGEKKTRVKVVLFRDGKKFIVQRTANPNSIILNGEDVGQETIDRRFLSYAVFTHTVLLGQGRPLFLDLRPNEKLELFTELLDLDKWDVRSKTAMEESSFLESEISNLHSSLSSSRLLVREWKTSVVDLESQSEEWESKTKDKRLDMKRTIDKTSKELKDVKIELRSQTEVLERRRGLVLKTLKALEAEEAVLSKIEDRQTELGSTIGKAQSELRRLVKQLDSLKTSKTCPTCGQRVKKDDLVSHKKELTRDIGKQEKIIDETSKELNKLKSVKIQKKKIKVLSSKLEDLEDKIDPLESRVSSLKIRKISIQSKLEHFSNHTSEDVNPYTKQIRELRSKLKKEFSSIKDLKETISKLSSRLKRVSFWIKGFKACRLYALEEVLEELRIVTAAIGTEFGLSDWVMDFQVEKETKSGSVQRGLMVTVQPPSSGKTIRWESFSGGERQRLRLIGSLALSEVLLNHAGLDIDFEILDEPTRHLSTEGVLDLIEFLPARAQRLHRKTFYTDHQAIESSNFNSTVTVVRNHKGVFING